ncbi:MAG TPA: hypothetical protein VFJ85_03910 [Acidimicrobiales bacterium]|nr:hypothetical protein [Acidimicrobiales bacterium]
MATTPVYLELGSKKVFACSLDWPGWCRSGRSEDDALEALAAYAARYAPVAAAAGARFPKAPAPEVVDRVPGSASTDFGVPGSAAPADTRPLTAAQAGRLAAIVEASWAALAEVAAGAPASLRKGPRGGGRDRDAVVEHVATAEFAYARKLGVRHKESKDPDAVAALRADLLAALRAARRGEPAHEKGWLPRYAARRIAWHAIDHAWEIEDRSEP